MDRNESKTGHEIDEGALKLALAELYGGPATPEASAEERLWGRVFAELSEQDAARAEDRKGRATAQARKRTAIAPWRWAAVAAFIALGLLATAILAPSRNDTWSTESCRKVSEMEKPPQSVQAAPSMIESGKKDQSYLGDDPENTIVIPPEVADLLDHTETTQPDVRSTFGNSEGHGYFGYRPTNKTPGGEDEPAAKGGKEGVNLNDTFESHESFSKEAKRNNLEDIIGSGAPDDSDMGWSRSGSKRTPGAAESEARPAISSKATLGESAPAAVKPEVSTVTPEFGDKRTVAAASENKYGPTFETLAPAGKTPKYADGVTPKDKPVLAPPPLDPYANLPEVNPNVKVLKGGAQDDNAHFSEFLDFLQRTNAPGAIKVDVSERVVLDLTDKDGYPLTNADVRIYHDGKCVHKVRTLADGRALFHPRAAGVDPQAQDFSVEVIAPPGCGEKQMDRTRFTGRQGVWKLQAPYARSLDPVKLDVLFCLDCTGSMSDEIERVQKTLMQMVAKFNALPGKPKTRWGLVQYRDRGDDYVTKVHDFTEDVAKFQKKLNACEAGGGGDEPESVNEALDKSVEGVDWDRGDAIRLVFLIGDAPPHMDYQNDVKYTESMAKAQRRAIKICPLAASGLNKTGELIFRQLAQYTLGRFLFISYGEGQNASTPHEVSQPNQSNNLDDLIVHVVANEVNARATRRPAQQEQQPQTDTWK